MPVARRYEAAGWLRKAVGVVAAKDLPDEPSEEEFRLGLRNGLILCNALNKIHPGAVPKVSVLRITVARFLPFSAVFFPLCHVSSSLTTIALFRWWSILEIQFNNQMEQRYPHISILRT